MTLKCLFTAGSAVFRGDLEALGGRAWLWRYVNGDRPLKVLPTLGSSTSSAAADQVQPSETVSLVILASLKLFLSDILVTPKQTQWIQLQTGLIQETKSFGSSGTDPGSGRAAVKSHKPAFFQTPTAEVWVVLIVFREQLRWQGNPVSPVPAFRASSGPHPGALGDLVFS